MKMLLILNSFKVLCDQNPLFKIQSVLCGRLAINHSAGQFMRCGWSTTTCELRTSTTYEACALMYGLSARRTICSDVRYVWLSCK